jgi:tetratricopeptide (TPR) repeat protein
VPTIDQLQRLLETEPEDTFLLYALAQEHAKAGNLADAIGAYNRVIALDPGHGYAYFHKARAQEQAGAPDAADTLRAGLQAARAVRDDKAAAEIAAYLGDLTG